MVHLVLAGQPLDARGDVDRVAGDAELRQSRRCRSRRPPPRRCGCRCRTAAPAGPSRAAARCSAASSARMSSAASTASRACQGLVSSAPNSASRPSPTSSLTWPWCRAIASFMWPKYSLRIVTVTRRVEPVAQRGEAAQVGEQHGHLPALGAKASPRIGQPLHHVGAATKRSNWRCSCSSLPLGSPPAASRAGARAGPVQAQRRHSQHESDAAREQPRPASLTPAASPGAPSRSPARRRRSPPAARRRPSAPASARVFGWIVGVS